MAMETNVLQRIPLLLVYYLWSCYYNCSKEWFFFAEPAPLTIKSILSYEAKLSPL
jgi:hypothetical protein